MGYKLNGKLLGTLIDEVIYPVETKLIEDMQLSEEDSIKLLKRVGFLRLSIAPFKKDVMLEDEMQYIEKIYQLPFEKAYVQELLGYYCDLYRHWVQKNLDSECKNLSNFKKIMDILQEAKSYSNNEEDLDTSYDEEFFDFDADFDDEAMNTMHYTESEKISAQDFMQTVGIDADVVADIEELLEKYIEISTTCNEVNEDFLSSVFEVVSKFSTVFELSGEFRDLGKSMNLFIEVLESLEHAEHLSEENATVLKLLFDAVMEDLEKWFQEIVVEQRAKDIHYLDASLLSSIEQIRILLESIQK